MKQRTQWIVACLAAASASAAMAGPGSGIYGPYGSSGAYGGFGIYTPQVYRTACEPGVVMTRRAYVVQSTPTVVWRQTQSPGEAFGNVVTAPFRLIGSGLAWTGRTLSGQPEPIAERTILAPVGERVIISKSTKATRCGKKVMLKKVTYLSQPALLPVGERFTTVRVFRSTPMLEPVGERITTIRTIRSERLLPVGEKITTVKFYRSHKLLPVGEKVTVIHHGKRLLPVGEKITTVKTFRTHKMLAPVGERTYIKTTRLMSAAPCGCW